MESTIILVIVTICTQEGTAVQVNQVYSEYNDRNICDYKYNSSNLLAQKELDSNTVDSRCFSVGKKVL